MSTTESSLPAEFAEALASADELSFRPEIHVTDIPAPEGIAPFARAWSATIDHRGSDADHGTARLVMLYDPSSPESWGGRFRAVCFAKAPLDQAMGDDPFLPKVAWSWLTDALDHRGASYSRASGTSSTIISTGFGELESDQVGTEIEMRASWSPGPGDLGSHVDAWSEFVCMLAGLPPVADGVTPIRSAGDR